MNSKYFNVNFVKYPGRFADPLFRLLKDEVLLTVGCPIYPPFYIDSQIFFHRKFKKIDQLIFRNAKEIYFNDKFPII